MYQKITVVGNLGADPTMKYLPNGTAVTNFSVAANYRYKDEDHTTWFRVSVFGSQAEACNEYLSKGRPVLVDGRLRADPQTGGPNIWTAQDGTVRASFEITANEVKFLPGSGDAGQPSQQASKPAASDEEDEIPF